MQVTGEVAGLWLPEWEGYATDSMDACSRARRWFYGELHREAQARQRYPLKVLSVVQVGV